MKFKSLYEQIVKTNKLNLREYEKLEKKFFEALKICESTKDKEICMQAILKNCDKIDDAVDTIKFYEAKLNRTIN